jgi:hypothetical protein
MGRVARPKAEPGARAWGDGTKTNLMLRSAPKERVSKHGDRKYILRDAAFGGSSG